MLLVSDMHHTGSSSPYVWVFRRLCFDLKTKELWDLDSTQINTIFYFSLISNQLLRNLP
jgi:hypothetical protein